jgi:hypothetical protein
MAGMQTLFTAKLGHIVSQYEIDSPDALAFSHGRGSSS